MARGHADLPACRTGRCSLTRMPVDAMGGGKENAGAAGEGQRVAPGGLSADVRLLLRNHHGDGQPSQ